MPLSSTMPGKTQTPKPVILALEASGEELSVALWAHGRLCAEECHAARHGHAAEITPMLDRVMAASGMAYGALTHVAAGRGPGSFTGIRVALATAKGLCLATGAVGMGVNGLAALAANLKAPGAVLVAAETRRGPCYAQFFDGDGAALTPIVESEIAAIGAHLPAGIGALAVAGWQANALAESLTESLGKSLGKSSDHHSAGPLVTCLGADHRVQAKHIAAYAEKLIGDGAPPNTPPNTQEDTMTPLYLAPAFLGPQKKLIK